MCHPVHLNKHYLFFEVTEYIYIYISYIVEQSRTQIYFMYAQNYNTGYVGRTSNIKIDIGRITPRVN